MQISGFEAPFLLVNYMTESSQEPRAEIYHDRDLSPLMVHSGLSTKICEFDSGRCCREDSKVTPAIEGQVVTDSKVVLRLLSVGTEHVDNVPGHCVVDKGDGVRVRPHRVSFLGWRIHVLGRQGFQLF
jgi:hypothetical protein